MGDELKVWLTAPPVDGQANQALISYLADALRVAKGKLEIVRGETSREKLIVVEDLWEDEVRVRLG